MPAVVEDMISSNNEVPWHGLGLIKPQPHLTSVEILDELDVLKAQIVQRVLTTTAPDGTSLVIPNQLANVRLTVPPKVVGVVGKRYKILQNKDAFQFMDTLVDSGEAHYVTAGSLYDGRVVWMLMELPDEVIFGGIESERIKRYILLKNSHDGSSAVEVAIVTVRVVCANTLSLALNTAPRVYKVRHTTNMDGKIAAAREALDIAFKYNAELDKIADQLVHTPMPDDEFSKFLNELVPLTDKDGKAKEGRGETVAKNTQGNIRALYYGAENLKPIQGTAWGALNAVIEYNDHGITRRETETSTSDENRFEAITNPLANGIVARAQKKVFDFAGIS